MPNKDVLNVLSRHLKMMGARGGRGFEKAKVGLPMNNVYCSESPWMVRFLFKEDHTPAGRVLWAVMGVGLFRPTGGSGFGLGSAAAHSPAPKVPGVRKNGHF